MRLSPREPLFLAASAAAEWRLPAWREQPAESWQEAEAWAPQETQIESPLASFVHPPRPLAGAWLSLKSLACTHSGRLELAEARQEFQSWGERRRG